MSEVVDLPTPPRALDRTDRQLQSSHTSKNHSTSFHNISHDLAGVIMSSIYYRWLNSEWPDFDSGSPKRKDHPTNLDWLLKEFAITHKALSNSRWYIWGAFLSSNGICSHSNGPQRDDKSRSPSCRFGHADNPKTSCHIKETIPQCLIQVH